MSDFDTQLAEHKQKIFAIKDKVEKCEKEKDLAYDKLKEISDQKGQVEFKKISLGFFQFKEKEELKMQLQDLQLQLEKAEKNRAAAVDRWQKSLTKAEKIKQEFFKFLRENECGSMVDEHLRKETEKEEADELAELEELDIDELLTK